MEGSPFLPLSEGLHIEQVTPYADELLVQISSSLPTACCPLCGTQAWRIHNRYTRRVADLPCAGQHVTLQLTVRKFFCPNPSCPRKIFAEQFPELVPSYARLTIRLRDSLVALGLATCGELTSRLAPKLGMTMTPTTILRRLRAVPVSPVITVSKLGVDDFAWKKGNHYGTILVDLEKHAVIDLLPDREKKTFKKWLKAHPEVRVISRDRASTYADAAKEAAPQATQVADRYHLLVNLREHLKSFLDHKRTSLPKVEIDHPDAPFHDQRLSANGKGETLAALMTPLVTEQVPEPSHQGSIASFVRDTKREKWFHQPSSAVFAQSQLSRRKRLARFEQVRALHQQGLSMRTIARELGMSRAVVSTFIQAETFPEQATRPRKGVMSKLDPFVPFLLERWQQGEYNGAHLYQEIRERGFTGSYSLVRPLLADLRRMHPPALGTRRSWVRKEGRVIEDPSFGKPSSPPQPKRKRLTPSQVAWLFVCHPEKLTEQQQLEIVCRAGDDLQHVYTLAQDFVTMITKPQADAFEPWLQRVQQSDIASLQGLAKGPRRDYAAVKAALTLPWSQGQVEGQVNRLKLIKRQMFGRAQFDLLRLHVLHAS
jgi:transposase